MRSLADFKPPHDWSSSWRDVGLSERHKTWGHACPGVDVDFLLVEYDLAEPMALVEYKEYRVTRFSANHASYRAIGELADRAKLPFWVAFYWHDTWAFDIRPMNALAKRVFRKIGKLLSEYDYVTQLYRIRKRKLPEELETVLKRDPPPGRALKTTK
jgi:hypothetical protein